MAITEAEAIKFCNEFIRPSADKLYGSFDRLRELSDRWSALSGTVQEKYDLLANLIKQTANFASHTYFFATKTRKLWEAGTIGSVIPNDPLEEVWDAPDGGSQDPNRPPITGQDVVRIKLRIEEFLSWLERGTDVDAHFLTEPNQTLQVTDDFLNDMLRVSNDGKPNPAASQGKLVAVDRATELVTEYTVTNPGKLTQILTVSVNNAEQV